MSLIPNPATMFAADVMDGLAEMVRVSTPGTKILLGGACLTVGTNPEKSADHLVQRAEEMRKNCKMVECVWKDRIPK